MLIRIILAGFLLLFVAMLLNGCASKSPATSGRQQSKVQQPVKKTGGSYRVRKGDSLYAIAWRAGLDYRTVARWNGLRSPYTIYPGQVIKLYPPKNTPKSSAVAGKSPKKKAAATKAKTASTKPATKPKKSSSVSSEKLHWQWPVKGRILSRYSSTDASRSGIEIAGRRGQKVLAAEAGEVVYVGSGLIGYGQLIIIKHNNKYLSAYGHNNDLLVKEGDRVKRGQHISNMGVTNQGQELLYFEVRRYGKPVDPLSYLPRG
ncbi:MAG TPA: LysM peptidoglycan-binding domain-containing protein [Thiolapillus brandeum]|uniref:LysM peptidoglycan-binding domain-containing protein n=1 Tax=Thiolapillus brandeum TaxID=1076588 RepID=A0A831NTT0_9GAMM|nr:LysM peptidoglycan-binding domain-containing protein [Thiolapillus brandeum]